MKHLVILLFLAVFAGCASARHFHMIEVGDETGTPIKGAYSAFGTAFKKKKFSNREGKLPLSLDIALIRAPGYNPEKILLKDGKSQRVVVLHRSTVSADSR